MKFNCLKKLVTFASLTAITSISVAKEPLKVGFVYADQIGDYGWTFEHDLARKKIDKKFGDAISTDYVITSKENAKSTITSMVKNHYDMIFVTSGTLGSATLSIARDNPNVNFSLTNRLYSLKNLSSYTARYEEGFYLAGIASAKLTKTKMIGVVGILRTRLEHTNINAFTLGAQSVDPRIKIKVIWTDKRADTEAEAAAVRKLKQQGVDTILQQSINPTVLKVAEEENLWVVGFNGRAKKHAPTKYVVSVMNDWHFYYNKEIKLTEKGDWTATNTWAGFNQGMVKLTPFNPAVPKETKAKITELKSKMSHGKFELFTGPVVYSDGEVFLKKGQAAKYHDIIKMKKFIKGIEEVTK